jgi:hypothetical protein
VSSKVKRITERDAALTSPIDLKKPGSVEWCWQIIYALKSVWDRKVTNEARWLERLKLLEEYDVWKKVPPENPYGSLDALLKAEIGVGASESKRIVKLRATPGAPEGNQNAAKVKIKNNAAVGRIVCGSNSTQYLTARLERDHPAIHKRLQRGEYKSVRAAAKEAGLVRDEIRMPRDPQAAAHKIFHTFNEEEMTIFIATLRERATKKGGK